MEQQEPIKKTTVYVLLSEYERLQVIARKHSRSFNSELVWLLEQALEQKDKHKGKPNATG